MPHFLGHQSIKGYNVDVAIGQMKSAGGVAHLKEQLACVTVPLLTDANFVDM